MLFQQVGVVPDIHWRLPDFSTHVDFAVLVMAVRGVVLFMVVVSKREAWRRQRQGFEWFYIWVVETGI